MKNDNFVNLFWTIVWAIVLIGTIVGIFWRPANYVVAIVAAVMLGTFLYDYIKVARLR